jgi:nitrite reductase/ring-hydroxylating ferredoxin subunit
MQQTLQKSVWEAAMTSLMDRTRLVDMVRHARAHAAADTIEQAASVMRIPATNYTDPARFEQEKAQIFKRLPLVLAATAELPKPGDYKAFAPAGVPVLLTRGDDGVVRGFVNSCPHRGANVAVPGAGSAKRFTCPYHGWTFARTGELIGVARADDFGDIDKSCYGLQPLPVAERAGLIFGVLDPKSTLDIDAYLCGYDGALAHFGFKDWMLFSQRTIRGPNWKIAYDGYLDFYHLPVLHKDTFGPDFPNRALYHAWGPHQRVITPATHLLEPGAPDEDAWGDAELLAGVWTIFPHVSIASFDGGGRGVMVSILMPGAHVGESFTTQLYLMEKPPSPEQEQAATEQFAFLERVVAGEDYDTGLRQQAALDAGGRDHVLFGRNEGGAQTFHGWVDRILAADDRALQALFPPARSAA